MSAVKLSSDFFERDALEVAPMLVGKILVRKNGDENVFRFDMSPHDGTLGIGADYHPSLRQSNKMADELTAFLRKITNWK